MVSEKGVFRLITISLAVVALALAIFYLALPEEKGFTELYLVGEPERSISPGGEYTFLFWVHNLENRDMVYGYEVYLGGEIEDSGKITLANGESTVITSRFEVDESIASGNLPISVKLPGTGQEIKFWTVAE